MNIRTSSVFGIVVGLLVIGAGCARVAQQDVSEGGTMMKKESGDMMEVRGDAMMKGDNMEKDSAVMLETKANVTVDTVMPAPVKDEAMMKSETMMVVAQKGSYEIYAKEKLAYAKAGGTAVLFFHAPWCPTCRAANKSLADSIIPDGLLVLKIDYDSSLELKKKYGVTSQHTFVQVDAEGNMIKKWLGSTTVTEIAAQVKS